MDFFRKAGETFEEKKREFMGGESTEFVCRSCEETVAKGYEYCPHCGEETVESLD